jgi:hypothetical protein
LIFRGAPLARAALGEFADNRLWQAGFVAASAIAFGLYHDRVSARSRLADTIVFGAVLAAVAVWDTIAGAILIHLGHNALSVPLRQSPDSIARWRRARLVYLVGLGIVAGAGVMWDATRPTAPP